MSSSPPPVGVVAQQADVPGKCMSLILHPDRFALQRSTSPDKPMTSASNVVPQKGDLPAKKYRLFPFPAIAAPRRFSCIPASNNPNADQEAVKFEVFPRLPPELQEMIWDIAIAVEHEEKRFLRVAPDGVLLERTQDDAEDAQIRIISDQIRRRRLVPSLLHACSYSREEAIKGYKLWGCADPITYEENSASIYVKPDIDTFFFGDTEASNFWFLYTCVFDSADPAAAAADSTARCNLIPQVGLIKHFAFDWELWSELLENDAIWLCNLDSAKELTIALGNPNHEPLGIDFPLFGMRAIAAGTVRGESAALAMAMTHMAYAQSKEDLAQMDWPEDKLKFCVASLSLGDIIGNSLEDERYLEDVLIEAHRQLVISDAYLNDRLKLIHQRRPQN